MANDLSIPKKYKGKSMWSFSKLDGFHGCKQAYYLQRVEKIRGRQNIWGLLGTTVHDCLEGLIKEEITIAEAVEILIKKLDDGRLAGITFPTESMEDNYKKSVIHYFNNFKLPDIDDYKIELKQFLELEDNNVIIGFIDFILKHNDGTIEIRDFKTSSAFTKSDLKSKARQLLVYNEMLTSNFKKINNVKVSFDMIKYCKVIHKGNKRSKTCERHKMVLLLESKVRKDLMEIYKDELIVDELVIHAISKNKIPEEIIDNYEILPHIVYYDFTDEDLKELYDWIYSTIKEVKEETLWESKISSEESKAEFWCKNLCGVNEYCNDYLSYCENSKEKNIPVDDDLF